MLLLAALNPRPPVSLRLLTSRSPALPLGVWLAAGGAGGALLSGLATALALREGRRLPRGRDGTAGHEAQEPWFGAGWPMGRGSATAEPEAPDQPGIEADDWPQVAGPERAPGEPPPTVSVPFRVLRRPQRSSSPDPGRPRATAAPAPTSAARSQAVAVATERQDPDDWTSEAEEDW